MKNIIIIVIAFFISFFGVGQVNTIQKESNRELKFVIDDCNKFSFDLFNKLPDKNSNTFISPLSVYSALAIFYGGAVGETKNELKHVMGINKDDSVFHKNFASLLSKINKIDNIYERIIITNAIWLQEGFNLKKTFKRFAGKTYDANIELLDFVDDPIGSCDYINNWIFNNTQGKIDKIISPQMINDRTRLLVTNTIYFNGEWVNKFDADFTQKDIFFNLNKSMDSVFFLNELQRYQYFENDAYQLIELPYINDMAMVIMLPKIINGSPNRQDWMQHYIEMENNKTLMKVNLSIPKFELSETFNIKSLLAKMEITKAFNLDAEFSNICSEPVFIQEVIQKARIKVDEDKTIASATTIVAMEYTSSPNAEKEVVKRFKANHPFSFFIKDSETGLIIFAGQLNNFK